MTQKQEKYFNDLKETFMAILEKEIKDVKERLEREGRKTTHFEENAETLRKVAETTIEKLGVKFLDRSTRDTFRVRIDNNIKILYLLGTKDEKAKQKESNQMTTPTERAKEAQEAEKWMRENQRETRDYNTTIKETFDANRNTADNIQNQERGMGKLQVQIS